MKNKFEYSINIPDDIDGSFVEIPSMVIQPLVENSIWHGFTHSEIKGKISITFEKQSNKLICIVSDNGIGRKRSMEMKGKADAAHDSKGIKLIEDRLRVWSKINGVNYELQITDNMDAGSGTRTQITILYTEND